jgi:hypothetical protein
MLAAALAPLFFPAFLQGEPGGARIFPDGSTEDDFLAGLPRKMTLESPALQWNPDVSPMDSYLELESGFNGAKAAKSSKAWPAFGLLPVDQSFTGRGYAMPGESSALLEPGRNAVSLQWGAANFFNFNDEGAQGKVFQNYELQTLAFGLRRGFEIFALPVELAAHLKVHYSGEGFLDAFIEFVERSVGRSNEARSNPFEGSYLEKEGRVLDNREGGGFGMGDLLFTAKVPILKGDWEAGIPQIIGRVALNLAIGDEDYRGGNYLGAAVGISHRLAHWLALQGDIRAAFPLEGESEQGLSLRPAAMGGAAGLEFLLGPNTSLGVQADVQLSPVEHTGLEPFDRDYGGLTLALNHRICLKDQTVILRAWGRENFEIFPYRTRSNADPDFACGVSLEFRY